MPKLNFQTIRIHIKGARCLLPRVGHVVYVFARLMLS
jgi:hypothetical protein